jgi:hypothetical protein
MTKQELIKELKSLAKKFNGNFEQVSKEMILLTIGIEKKPYHFKLIFDKRSAQLIANINGLYIDYKTAPTLDDVIDTIKFWLNIENIENYKLEKI